MTMPEVSCTAVAIQNTSEWGSLGISKCLHLQDLFLFVSVSPNSPVSVCVCVCLSVSACMSACLPVCLSADFLSGVLLYFCLSLSLSLPVSVSIILSDFVSLYCLSFSLSFLHPPRISLVAKPTQKPARNEIQPSEAGTFLQPHLPYDQVILP